jgi:ATP-dependent Clp protease adaptor protein ClpS
MLTIEPPVEPRSRSVQPKKQPLYGVTVYNDRIHTIGYVVAAFGTVFFLPVERATALAKQIEIDGQGIVYSGSREVCELKCDQLRGVGHNFDGLRAVEIPL